MGIITGRKVVTSAGTRVPLSATSLEVIKLYVAAEESNTGMIVIGDVAVVASAATRQGYPLAHTGVNPNAVTLEGDLRVEGRIDLANVYVDSAVNGDGVTYLAITPG